MSLFSMNKLVPATLIVIAAAIVAAPQALADDTSGSSFDMSSFSQPMQTANANDGLVAAAPGQDTQQAPRQNYVPSPSRHTANQRLPLAIATRTILSQQGRQSLPKTNLDSFVFQSGMSESIYGDEGTDSIPPMMGMDESHTIGSGISSGGLTTGHSSNLPSAWCTYE